jgi:hypothetical protein
VNGPGGIRTPDLCDANAALSQLSHRPVNVGIIEVAAAGVKGDGVIPRPLGAWLFLASRAGVLLHCA